MGVQFSVKAAQYGRKAAGLDYFNSESHGTIRHDFVFNHGETMAPTRACSRKGTDAPRLATRPRGFAGGDGAHFVSGALNFGAGGIEIVGGFA